jgi:hypothetical protein
MCDGQVNAWLVSYVLGGAGKFKGNGYDNITVVTA